MATRSLSWYSDDEVETKKILKLRNECLVTKKINNYFCNLRATYNCITDSKKIESFDIVDKFGKIKCFCEEAIEEKTKIETLVLILFPEYSKSRIDNYSLNDFLKGENCLIQVILFRGKNLEESAYVYFEPVKKEEGK